MEKDRDTSVKKWTFAAIIVVNAIYIVLFYYFMQHFT